MAKKMIYVSDQSGLSIADGQAAKVRITFSDARKGVREADLTASEAEALANTTNARPVARRGRKPASAS